jgi:hypothetical protein
VYVTSTNHIHPYPVALRRIFNIIFILCSKFKFDHDLNLPESCDDGFSYIHIRYHINYDMKYNIKSKNYNCKSII